VRSSSDLNMNLHEEDARALVAAIEKQTQSWAAELHKNACQSLAGTGILLATMQRAAEKGLPVPLDRLQEVQKSIEKAIDQLRKLAQDFSPIQLEGTGLMLALFDFAEQLSTYAKCTLICEKPVLISDSRVALNLYRSVQEICRIFGEATAADFTISLSSDQNHIVLQIVKKGDHSNDRAVLARLRMLAIGGECAVQTSAETEIITLRVPVRISRIRSKGVQDE
jgi:signal transduction histidine kinase